MSGIQKISLEEIVDFAELKLTQHGLYNNGWRFEFYNKRAGTLGLCNLANKVIRVNKHYVVHGINASIVKDTVLHEIAHALRGIGKGDRRGRGAHDALWRRYAVMVGANPRATASSLDGYVPPAGSFNWVVAYVDHKNDVHHQCSTVKFLNDIQERFLKGRRDTKGRLWMVKAEQWEDYISGLIDKTELLLWDTNPNLNPNCVYQKVPTGIN